MHTAQPKKEREAGKSAYIPRDIICPEPHISVAFDNLKAAQRLSAIGFSEEQAETLAATFAEGVTENLATKDYAALLQKDIKALDTKIVNSVAGLEDRMDVTMANAKFDPAWRLLGGVALHNGLMFALIRYMPPPG